MTMQITPRTTKLRKHLLARQEQGFALIITLVMMALLMIISLAMLSLASIVTRSATQVDAQSHAEDNARMALMIAVGQLQAHAGSDERITATADIAGSADGSALANETAPENDEALDGTSKGLSPVAPGTRYWTGVWQNRDPVESIYTKTPAPELIQWLVSGNEHMPKTVTPASPEYALNADGSVVDPEKSVVLVGSNTVGNMTPQATTHVAAPLVEIADQNGTRTGRYAWWVGDEGVKAKFNIVAPYEANQLADSSTLSSQRSGWETVDGFSDYPLPGAPESPVLQRVITLPQSSLMSAPPDPAALSFHAATTESFGLLTDTLQGGLRLDLTSLLRGPLPTTRAGGYPNGVATGQNIIPAVVSELDALKGPTWDHLKDFSEFAEQNLENGVLQVRPAGSDNDYAIAPAILDLRMLFGVQLVRQGETNNYRLHPAAKIAVTLANPYAYPIQWDGLDLEFKLSFGNNSGISHHSSRIYVGNNRDTPAYFPSDRYRRDDTGALFHNAIFRIPAGTLPAGGAEAYTHSDRVVRPVGSVDVPVVVNMARIGAVGANARNFDHSLVMQTTYTRSPNFSLDMREPWRTSQIDAELRPAGGYEILRKLERFELDNGDFRQNRRSFTNSNAPNLTLPVGLQLYSFQLSQPGVNYQQWMPSSPTPSDWMGLRSSTMRTFADFNLQATRFGKPIASYHPPPFFVETADSSASLPFTAPGGDTGSAFTRNLFGSPLRWGHSPNTGATRTVLFAPPSADETLVSLAQLQHADLTADADRVSVGHQPGNAFGNSYASPFVSRHLSFEQRLNHNALNRGNPQAAYFFDISYLLNTSVWDTYFFSGIPEGYPDSEVNPRLVRRGFANPLEELEDLQDGTKAASRLMINGAFNINSTSKDAWKAFLASSKHLRHPADTEAKTDAMFPRSLAQPSTSQNPPSGHSDDSFSGYRRLTDAQIDALATEIVKQVRLRGPFVSLSHFVNRALVELDTNKELGRSGALQSALDLSGLNISPADGSTAFTNINVAEDRVRLQALNNRTRGDMDGTSTESGWPDPWAPRSKDNNKGAVASILADRAMLTNSSLREEQGFRSTGIPGWLTQADLLQVIGPAIAARSDTFRIRAYGETLDANGKVIAKAWCEAIVQRVPEYVDPTNQPDAHDDLTQVNQAFGRKFTIVSFRWLSPDEI